jgi:hypothetical protein
MVALKPDLKQIAEMMVFGQLLGGKMAMIIEYGLPGRIFRIEIAGSFTL